MPTSYWYYVSNGSKLVIMLLYPVKQQRKLLLFMLDFNLNNPLCPILAKIIYSVWCAITLKNILCQRSRSYQNSWLKLILLESFRCTKVKMYIWFQLTLTKTPLWFPVLFHFSNTRDMSQELWNRLFWICNKWMLSFPVRWGVYWT